MTTTVTRPVLGVATAPNVVWSWDITTHRGPDRGTFCDLDVDLDIYSRYLAGWTLAASGSGGFARDLIADCLARQQVGRHTLTIHADRGTPMTTKPVSPLLIDLDARRRHNRPHVPDDNPHSESAFKTLKYYPAFPDRFGSIADARAFAQKFITYDNHEYRQAGIGLHTPASVHDGTAVEIRAQRTLTLDATYAADPHRFTGRPRPPTLPTIAWINEPLEEVTQTA